MESARELAQLPGVVDVAVVMATEANKAILRNAGLLSPEAETATANDVVIALRAETESAGDQALEAAEISLSRRGKAARTGLAFRPRTIRGVQRAHPDANLALISVAGRYAAAEAWEALRSGLHVLLFSDNVPLEEEVALKRYAVERGLLMMGPGCGTAIIDKAALGFANVVPQGPVGIVSASGTGLQEVSTLLARLGIGITQGIGVGGRDLHEAVGGAMMLQGLRLLEADAQTQVVVLLSKPPSPAVAGQVLQRVREGAKPAVVCFLGGDPGPAAAAGAIPARTLQETAYLAAAQVDGYSGVPVDEVIERERLDLQAQAAGLGQRRRPGKTYLRGLFSGGTLAAEALVVLEESLDKVLSNVAPDPRQRLPDATRSRGHCVVDLGEAEFTVGRPHPMIDNDLRIRRLLQEAADPEVAVILLDVVLGYGAHPDPAAELGPAVYRARAAAAAEGRELVVVASVTGTEQDSQGWGRQVRALEAAGAIVAPCNAAAARLAGFVVA